MKILCLSPHVDDVDIACAGSIARFIRDGDLVYYLTCTPESQTGKDLTSEFDAAMKLLGVREYKILNLNNRHLEDDRQKILDALYDLGAKFAPDIVIGPARRDLHQDHATVYREMCRAFKTTCSILSYELPWCCSSFEPQLFVRITRDDMIKKYQVLQCYISQRERPYMTKETIKGLASVRGVQCNAKYAEAFEVVRWLM